MKFFYEGKETSKKTRGKTKKILWWKEKIKAEKAFIFLPR